MRTKAGAREESRGKVRVGSSGEESQPHKPVVHHHTLLQSHHLFRQTGALFVAHAFTQDFRRRNARTNFYSLKRRTSSSSSACMHMRAQLLRRMSVEYAFSCLNSALQKAA